MRDVISGLKNTLTNLTSECSRIRGCYVKFVRPSYKVNKFIGLGDTPINLLR